MTTKCKVAVFIREDDDSSDSSDPSWDEQPIIALDYVYQGDINAIQNRSGGLWRFTASFEAWFREKKQEILSCASYIQEIDPPSFFIEDNRIIGVCHCVPDTVSIELDITWSKAEQNYRDWFGYFDFDLNDDFEQIQELYTCIRDKTSCGVFEVKLNDDGSMMVSSPIYDAPSFQMAEADRQLFLQYLDSLYELTIDGEASFRHNMAKDD